MNSWKVCFACLVILLPINLAVGNDSVDSALATLLGTDVANGKAVKKQSGSYDLPITFVAGIPSTQS